MKLAIIGSRSCTVENLNEFLPNGVTQIISGGAKGIDACARKLAADKQIPLVEFLPEYNRFGRAAPIKRNDTIIDASDFVLIFWDGKSKGTNYVINQCRKKNKLHKVILLPPTM